MGSYMIWDIVFKDIDSRISFEILMKKERIPAKLIYDNYDGNVNNVFDTNFLYDVGYLGYAEAEEQKYKLIKLGVLKLNQICLCDEEGDSIISKKNGGLER